MSTPLDLPQDRRQHDLARARHMAELSVRAARAGAMTPAVACQWAADMHMLSGRLWTEAQLANDPGAAFFDLASRMLTAVTSSPPAARVMGVTDAIARMRAAWTSATRAAGIPIAFAPTPHLAVCTIIDLYAAGQELTAGRPVVEYLAALGAMGDADRARGAIVACLADVSDATGDRDRLYAQAMWAAMSDRGAAGRSAHEVLTSARQVLGHAELVRLEPYLERVSLTAR